MSLEESLRLTVAALMQATGDSQRGIAEALGLTQTQVSRRQSGTASWQLDDVDALADHYGVRPLELLDGPTLACDALPESRLRTAKERERENAREQEKKGAIR